jgi:hypothetical protein
MSDALPFSAAFAAAAEAEPGPTARIGALAEKLGPRSYGIWALLAGLLLLIPVPLVLPQIAGLILIAVGVKRLSGQDAAAPLIGRFAINTHAFATGFRVAFGWLESLWRARLPGLIGAGLAGLALLLAGVAALTGPSALLGLGAILLGYGLMQRDGLFTLAGAALCFGASVYVLTMLGGLIAGAPYAAGWGQDHVRWLADLLHGQSDILPPDHASRP